MPELVEGYNFEQKVVTVPNNDTDINAEIATQAEDDWIAGMLTLSGSDVIISFHRNVVIVLP